MTDLTTLYDGVLEATDDGGVIRFERTLPYEIRDVWAAVTEPVRLAEWWLPFEADITIDLRPGGQIVFSAVTGDPPPMSCEVLRVEAPMLLEHTHMAEGSWMRWELEPVDAGTVLRLSHFLPDIPNAVEGNFLVGLHTSLARLEPCLAGRPVPWDWDLFTTAQAAYAERGAAAEDWPGLDG
jgi:uncharacterized protein YndB with AHSA1/START domain